MKKIFVPLAFSLLYCGLYAQKSAHLDSARAQIARKHYLTALETLARGESEPEATTVLLTTLFIEHSEAVSAAYNKWTLSDRSGNTLIRSRDIDLPLEDFLVDRIAQFPNSCGIYSSLSRLYTYGIRIEHRYLPLETLQGMKNFLEKKVPANCADEYYYYVVGYAANYLGKPAAALADLQKALSQNPGFAPAMLELGNSYFLTKDYPNAIKSAKKAFELTPNYRYKSRSALLIAESYDAQNDSKNALSNYLLADSINRKEFFNQKALLNFYVKTNNPKASDAINSFLGAQGRTSVSNYLDVLDIYTRHNRVPDLSMYCQKALATYEGRKEIQGCFNFLLGIIYQPLNIETAKQHFRKAKEQGVKAEHYTETRNHPVTAQTVKDAFELIK